MGLEQKINYQLNKYPGIKKAVKRLYQLGMYAISPKIKSEGDIVRLSSNDPNNEYFFGYYDKSPWDATGRYMLCMRANDTWGEPDPLSSAEVLLFDLNLDGKAILFKGDSDEEISHNIDNAIAQMKELFSSYPHIRYFGGVGQVACRISDIPSSFTWANRAYAHQYLTSESDFLFGSEEGLHSQRDDVILSEIDPRHIDRRLVKEFLRMGDESETEFFLDEFFKGMGKNAIRSTMLRQYISMDIYFTVSDFVMNELGLSKEEVDAQVPQSDMLSDEKTTYDYLVGILKKAIALRKRSSQSHYREVIGEVISYIDQHYSDEELSLNTLAAHVNFSPNHLSAVFRQEMGQTFIKYLTDYRLDKAKELLLSTSRKSNEIGAMVGYKDPHYFSYLFKKTTGMTTTQYRGKGRAEDEE